MLKLQCASCLEPTVAGVHHDCSEVIAALRAETERLWEAGPGAIAAIEERIRQKSVEGWTPDHDAQHTAGQLARAAAAYAINKMPVVNKDWWVAASNDLWPSLWDEGWDKREKHSRERSLEIAAALCMAELDRLTELRRRAGVKV